MKTQRTRCGCCGQTIRAARAVVVSAKRTDEMTDAELFAHFKKTSHVDDARFFLAHATMSARLRSDAADVVARAEAGASRADVLAALCRVQNAWRREKNIERVFKSGSASDRLAAA